MLDLFTPGDDRVLYDDTSRSPLLVVEDTGPGLLQLSGGFTMDGGCIVPLNAGDLFQSHSEVDRRLIDELSEEPTPGKVATILADVYKVPVAIVTDDPEASVDDFLEEVEVSYDAFDGHELGVEVTLGLTQKINGRDAAYELYDTLADWTSSSDESEVRLVGRPDGEGDDFALRAFGSVFTVVRLDRWSRRKTQGRQLLAATTHARNWVDAYEIEQTGRVPQTPRIDIGSYEPDPAS